MVLNLIVKRLATADALRAPFVDLCRRPSPSSRSRSRAASWSLERATDAARELFGDAFVIVPSFRFHQPAQTSSCRWRPRPPIADAFAVEEWLHSVARVRPAVADVTWAMAVVGMDQRPIADPRGDPVAATAGHAMDRRRVHRAAAGGRVAGGVSRRQRRLLRLQCGLVVDEWIERRAGGERDDRRRVSLQPPQRDRAPGAAAGRAAGAAGNGSGMSSRAGSARRSISRSCAPWSLRLWRPAATSRDCRRF